jgi:hypothetical protein
VARGTTSDGRPKAMSPTMTAAAAAGAGREPPFEFSIRIIALDHSMEQPHELFDRTHSSVVSGAHGSPVPLAAVPVIRVFGATPHGQRSCLHVHQVHPYFYVPYLEDWEGGDDPGSAGEGVQRTVRQLVLELDERLGSSAPRQQQRVGGAAAARGGGHHAEMAGRGGARGGGGRRSRCTHIVDCEVVRGIPLYGYTPSARWFLKVSVILSTGCPSSPLMFLPCKQLSASPRAAPP